MSPAEYKAIEGQRVQQVLGAIGALPAAMLVFGDGPTVSAAGAPLFAAAIAMVIGALMNWNYTDAAYYLDAPDFIVPPEEEGALKRWQVDLRRFGYTVQHRTYGYGVVSLLCSIFGTAGVYSTLRSGISVNLGFWLAVAVSMATCVDVVLLGLRRNQLLEESRRLSTTSVA